MKARFALNANCGFRLINSPKTEPDLAESLTSVAIALTHPNAYERGRTTNMSG
jgi:hypothetical protein